MRFPFELTRARNIQGRKDPSRTFTIIEGLITLPDNKRVYTEALIQRQDCAPGQYAIELDIDTDRNRRLTVFVRGLHPVSAPQKAAA